MFDPVLNFGLGDEVDALRDTVHAWAQARLKPIAADIDRQNQFPPALWREMGALGLLGITVDPAAVLWWASPSSWVRPVTIPVIIQSK